ncbi:MAG TPA: ATP-binding cassette domain-containing protein, partial [Alphaproteobacteria bacterium]|nr:ATP-binding cassette domain-containing protein [Alphaproteobacteria bacterium]
MTIRNKIEMRGVTKSFGTKHVLQGVDMDLPVGSSMVIIGGSGTGKSVTLKCILGLLQADNGSIKVDGVEVVGASTRTREEMMKKFGMLFQGGALFDSLPIWHNVAFGLIHGKDVSKKEARHLAIEKLEQVGMG